MGEPPPCHIPKGLFQLCSSAVPSTRAPSLRKTLAQPRGHPSPGVWGCQNPLSASSWCGAAAKWGLPGGSRSRREAQSGVKLPPRVDIKKKKKEIKKETGKKHPRVAEKGDAQPGAEPSRQPERFLRKAEEIWSFWPLFVAPSETFSCPEKAKGAGEDNSHPKTIPKPMAGASQGSRWPLGPPSPTGA